MIHAGKNTNSGGALCSGRLFDAMFVLVLWLVGWLNCGALTLLIRHHSLISGTLGSAPLII